LADGPQISRVAFAFTRHLIAQDLGAQVVDVVAAALQRELRAAAGGSLSAERLAEVDNLRRFTCAFRRATDTGAVTAVTLDYAVGDWIETNYAHELAEFRLQRPIDVRLSRDPARMPRGTLGRINAARCSVREFNEWLYFMRNVRDFVVTRPVGAPWSQQRAFTA
jgi:hypothetical protein